MVAIYTHKCEQKWLQINNRGEGIGTKMSWVEKNRKINNQGGDDYSWLESKLFNVSDSSFRDMLNIHFFLKKNMFFILYSVYWLNSAPFWLRHSLCIKLVQKW